MAEEKAKKESKNFPDIFQMINISPCIQHKLVNYYTISSYANYIMLTCDFDKSQIPKFSQ